MKKFKIIVLLTAVACLLSSFTACGSDNSEETAQQVNTTASTTAEAESIQTMVTVKEPADKTRKKLTAITNSDLSILNKDKTIPKSYSHSNKVFTLMNYSCVLTMENGWEISTGGVATDNQSDPIRSFPAVIQYLDTKTNITIEITEEIIPTEDFLAKTEEMYVEEYGNNYDSIEITQFKQLKIDDYDSFEIKADVTVDGESYKMIHVISANVKQKSFSWLMLDCDGTFENFSIPDAISYPIDITKSENYKKMEEHMKLIEELKERDLDSYYKFNIDDFR
ncbi:MAG: hypothetical protein IJA12_01570 [Oscillospiraceae bacterium]|nr:hypothetical protein [Oscillospiraceae bacterium]